MRRGGSTARGVILGAGVTLVVAFAVVVGAVTLLGKTSTWTTWTALDGSFTIDFPGTPQTPEGTLPHGPDEH